jgi:hypothetical protein
MMYHSFDTLEVAKSFVASGMKTEIAEAVAKAIAVSRDTDLSHLTTKADLMEVENKLESKISAIDSRVAVEIEKVRSDIEKSKNEVLKWVVGMNIATISILMTFFKFFVH